MRTSVDVAIIGAGSAGLSTSWFFTQVHFAGDLAASVDFGDARLRESLNMIEAHCRASGLRAPHLRCS